MQKLLSMKGFAQIHFSFRSQWDESYFNFTCRRRPQEFVGTDILNLYNPYIRPDLCCGFYLDLVYFVPVANTLWWGDLRAGNVRLVIVFQAHRPTATSHHRVVIRPPT